MEMRYCNRRLGGLRDEFKCTVKYFSCKIHSIINVVIMMARRMGLMNNQIAGCCQTRDLADSRQNRSHRSEESGSWTESPALCAVCCVLLLSRTMKNALYCSTLQCGTVAVKYGSGVGRVLSATVR